MNYKKIITSVLLVSDGPVDHAYFCDNFEISEKELLELLAEINDSLSENDFGFKIKYNDLNSDFLTTDDVTKELIDFKPPSILRGLSTPALETLSIVAYEQIPVFSSYFAIAAAKTSPTPRSLGSAAGRKMSPSRQIT